MDHDHLFGGFDFFDEAACMPDHAQAGDSISAVPVSRNGQSPDALPAGVVRSVYGNIGLATLRLPVVRNPPVIFTCLSSGVIVEPSIPEWWPAQDPSVS